MCIRDSVTIAKNDNGCVGLKITTRFSRSKIVNAIQTIKKCGRKQCNEVLNLVTYLTFITLDYTSSIFTKFLYFSIDVISAIFRQSSLLAF